MALLNFSQDCMDFSTLLSLSRSPFLGFTTLNLLPTELKLLSWESLEALLICSQDLRDFSILLSLSLHFLVLQP